MKLRTIKYFFKESFTNLWRNRVMMFAAVVSVVAALFIVGTVLLTLMNVNNIVLNMESQVEITVFLEEEVSADTIQELRETLEDTKGVNEVKFESKEEALEKAKDWLKEKEDLLEGFAGDKNPLPNSFILKIDKPEYASRISKSIENKPGVDKVKFGEQIVKTLSKLARITRWAGLVITIVLTVIALVIISNTIKLALMSRIKEIQIMKYVGATDWFIRWPFILEGLLIGIISTIISTLLISFAYNYAVSRFGSMVGMINMLRLEDVIRDIFCSFLVVGCAIGTIGSVLSIRKYMKV
ncbi:MAG: permease-like cell division protein FtsX [Clostridia bacterium]|nr:permease-like cell division protein FtsX [Clostridia bacterium]